MELDDLKNTWQQNNFKKITNTDIMELIQHKSYGPVAALKKAFLKQIRLMIIVPIIIFLTNADDVSKVLSSVMFWSYIAFCIGVITFSYYNYKTVNKMEGMDKMVRSNLEHQITILEERLRWHKAGLRIALLYFILLTEILPYFQHYRMLDKWHSASPVIRYGVYVMLLVIQYTFSRVLWDRKFGSHLRYLKELVKEMQY